eukprot:Gb_09340 [translate_table: standard]
MAMAVEMEAVLTVALQNYPISPLKHFRGTHKKPATISSVFWQCKRNCLAGHAVWKGKTWIGGGVNVVAKEATMAPSGWVENENENDDMYDCVVVGGGISGLSTAQALVSKHSSTVKNVVLTEAKDRVGGNIMTMERDGYLWEEGPNSFQPTDPMLTMVWEHVRTGGGCMDE